MLSKYEKELISEIWEKLTPVASEIGADALFRMFTTFPGSKTYFAHLNINHRSPHLLSHGKDIVLAIAEGARDISSLTVTLAPLQTLHAYQLRIDPINFKVVFQSYLFFIYLIMELAVKYEISQNGIYVCLITITYYSFYKEYPDFFVVEKRI
ncbi:hemoglobin subunit alpha-D-like [Osmerus mordax]|uniref:Hemoglobin subunit alpha-D n=1 Tax=Osmerus mordax TaxID=8014 RepID=C1BLX7_OSMMO|nr:Hemoglobin subunit alpha-D [Osmerus mordax]